MFIRRTVLFCSLLIAAFVFSFTVEAQKEKSSEQEWVYITASKSDHRDIYISPKRILASENNAIKAWIKMFPRGPFANFLYQKTREKNGLNIKGYDKYSHTLELVEMNCSKRQMRCLISIDYDEQGEVLGSRNTPKAEWDDVIPESIGETMLEKVCSYQKMVKD